MSIIVYQERSPRGKQPAKGQPAKMRRADSSIQPRQASSSPESRQPSPSPEPRQPSPTQAK
ncbi:hypothetical protein DPMN_076825 [Dreissena polymorpha]|uniref:Uncharacterized protein n=1 Tax=Dreissena polymorpha TaxID=45954 RepID=A0A9D3YN45_DREPO|nr:hypothetical protein DPMN_076825 [Dreissena polymorpha]